MKNGDKKDAHTSSQAVGVVFIASSDEGFGVSVSPATLWISWARMAKSLARSWLNLPQNKTCSQDKEHLFTFLLGKVKWIKK